MKSLKLMPRNNERDAPLPSKESPKPVGRAEMVAVGIMLLIAVIVRVIYLIQYRAQIPYWHNVTLDSHFYDLWAQRVAEGKGYGPSPFYMAPLYPYVLATIYMLAGHKLVLVYFLQAFLGVANTLLVYMLARRVLGHAVGLIAMGLVIFYGPLMYIETKLLTEPLAVTLSLVSLILLIKVFERPSFVRYLGVGVLIGVSAVCRPAALVFVVLFAIWFLVIRGRALQSATGEPRASRALESPPTYSAPTALVPLLLGVVLAIVPVTARNMIVGKDFAILSTNAGIVFAQGNSRESNGISTPLPGFSGSILYQQQEEMERASRALGRPVKPSESSAYWLKVGLTDIREDPARFLGLLGKKVVWSLHNRESPCSYNFYYEASFVPILRALALPFPLIFGLGVIGFVLARKRRGWGVDLIALYALSIFLSLVMFSVSSRYRAPMVPALAIFAGYALVNLRERNLRSVGIGLGVIALSFLPSLAGFPTPPISPEAPSNMGLSFLAIGKVDRAITEFRKSLDIAPDYAVGHNNLGIALVRQGKLDQAAGHYREALRLIPDYPEAHYNLGEVLYKQRRLDEAIAHCRAALAIRPDHAPIHVCLANSLLLQGRIDQAIDEYQEALRLQPNVPDAQHNLDVALEARRRMGGVKSPSGDQAAAEHYNMGNALMRQGKHDQAIREFREAIRLRPDFGRAHNNLAVVLFLTGDYSGAWREVDLARKYGAEPNPGFIRGLSEKMPR